MVVGKIVVDNQEFLEKIVNAKPKEKGEILKNANSEQLLALVEICLNVLNSRVELDSKIKKSLYKHKEFLRQFSKTRSTQGARKIVNQKGAGVAIAAVLIPVLAELASHLINQL